MKKCYKHLNNNFKSPLLLFDNQDCPICLLDKELKKLKSDNSDYAVSPTAAPKLPSLDDVLKHKKFTPDMNWVEKTNEIYNTIKKLGNFA